MHRLVAYAHNGVQRWNIDRDELVIGSDEDCDVHLPFAGVGHRHARLLFGDGEVTIEDLGSRRGLVVNGERVRECRLEVLDEIRLGSIALLLEDVAKEAPATEEPDASRPMMSVMTPESMLEHLAKVSRWVLSDATSSITLESLITDLLADFGGGVLFLFQGEEDRQGIKFVVATEARWLGHGQELLRQIEDFPGEPADRPTAGAADGFSNVSEGSVMGQLDGRPAWVAHRSLAALDRPYLFTIALPNFQADGGSHEGDDWSPMSAFRTLADQLILGLVHHVGQYEPILFGRTQEREVTLAPGLILGESTAMKRVLDELRGAVDLPEPVLLRGEVGVSKELLARSLHLSGERAELPFVVASCGGASEQRIEADLFGAEIAGRSDTMVRDGKLRLADGGTLYLSDVDQLPMRLQHRLMRFLRHGEVEPVDSAESHRVDILLIASSLQPLEVYVSRDQFRLDLAYRLSQYLIDVPSLRDRREDLPLLIQVAVNRCCHQTGKRIQGITVKAMESLAKYDYPGNLPELESIVRRLVYLCPSGRPIDDAMLPEEVRLSKISGLRPDVSTELNLEKLVADTERAAIREALRRSDSNKSAASRELGLSRNGLNMKMKRLGLED